MVIVYQDRWFAVTVGCFVLLMWLCLQIPGGISESIHGDLITYAYGWWTVLYVIGPAVVMLMLGRLLWNSPVADPKQINWGPVCLILAVVSMLLGPLMLSLSWCDRLEVNDVRILVTSGCHAPATQEIRFKDCKALELGSTTSKDSKGRETVSWYLRGHYPRGEPIQVWVDDMLKRAMPHIIEKAEAAGVPFQLAGDRPDWLDASAVPHQ